MEAIGLAEFVDRTSCVLSACPPQNPAKGRSGSGPARSR